MTHLRSTTAALAVAACALAVGAAPALAHEFVASKPGKIKGVGLGNQMFTLKPFKITCTSAKTKGLTAGGSSNTFFASIRYKGCTTAAQIGGEPITLKTKFKTPVDIEYHANGFVEVGSEEEVFEGSATLKGGEVEIGVKTVKCEIFWEEQTIPIKAEKKPEAEYEEALYSTASFSVPITKKFPTGVQNKLVITNEFKKLVFEYEEGQCEKFAKSSEEQKKGKVDGQLQEELVGGQLEFH